MSQCERLLARLKLGPVTPMDAWAELGIYRLSGRILDLREQGHDITSERADVLNKFGEVCRVARYRLIAANDGSVK